MLGFFELFEPGLLSFETLMTIYSCGSEFIIMSTVCSDVESMRGITLMLGILWVVLSLMDNCCCRSIFCTVGFNSTFSTSSNPVISYCWLGGDLFYPFVWNECLVDALLRLCFKEFLLLRNLYGWWPYLSLWSSYELFAIVWNALVLGLFMGILLCCACETTCLWGSCITWFLTAFIRYFV